MAHLSLAAVYRKKGHKTEYDQEVEVSRPLLDEEGEYKYNRACFEAICGNVDEALALLKETLARKQVHPKWIDRDPNLEFIRDDRRFHTLVEQFQGETPQDEAVTPQVWTEFVEVIPAGMLHPAAVLQRVKRAFG